MRPGIGVVASPFVPSPITLAQLPELIELLALWKMKIEIAGG
jgi:hypothetical protein